MPETVPDRFRWMLCIYDERGNPMHECPEIRVYSGSSDPVLVLEAGEVSLKPCFYSKGLKLWMGAPRGIGGCWAAVKSYATHVGNIHWLEVEMSEAHTMSMLSYIRRSLLYGCGEGWTEAYEWWNTAPHIEAVTPEALGFEVPPPPIPGLTIPDPNTLDLFPDA